MEKKIKYRLADLLAESDDTIKNVVVGIASSPSEYTTRAGKPYLDMPIMDHDTRINARIWDNVNSAKASILPGSIWELQLRKSTYQGVAQLSVVPGDSYLVAKSVEEFEEDYAHLKNEIIELVSQTYPFDIYYPNHFLSSILKDPDIPALGKTIFAELFGIDLSQIGPESFNMITKMEQLMHYFKDDEAYYKFKEFCTAPAAASHHGAKIHGLLVHTVTELRIIESVNDVYCDAPAIGVVYGPIIGKVLATVKLVCSMHDYFKMHEYDYNDFGAISFNSDSSTFYHDMRLAFKVQSIYDRLKEHPDFGCEEDSLFVDKITHAIMRHHGQWADYQPSSKLENHIESEVFHLIDVLDSRLISHVEKG